MNTTNESWLAALNTGLSSVVNAINGVLWGQVLVYLLVIVGVYFTVRLGFIQLRQFKHATQILKSGREVDNGLSSYQVLYFYGCSRGHR
ncbi:hypothetical protein [Vibrio taketomensis]|uniref:hypothetical protein n=1 Tax=Vibrio taketomensis TaxID=2572923 RepID=UPI001E585731|nr:hypothetical protein [Vibrio taketomensis]